MVLTVSTRTVKWFGTLSALARTFGTMPHKQSTKERVLTLIDQGLNVTQISRYLKECLDRDTINRCVKERREQGCAPPDTGSP